MTRHVLGLPHKPRNFEGSFAASEFHVIGDYSSVTAPDDSFAASDISFNCLINPFTDYEYDSRLEVSETQFETLETGEMSHDDESVSVLADRVLPSVSRVALRVAPQITGDEGN